MKPIIYEIRRAVTNKSALVVLGLMILIPSLIAFSSASGTSSSFYTVNDMSYGWGSNGSYHGTVLLYNNYGEPVSGLAVNFTLGQNNTTVVTNNQGFANATFNGVTNKMIAITYSYQYASSGGPLVRSLPVYLNQTNPYFINDTFQAYGPNGSINTTYSASRFSFQMMNVRNNPKLNGLVMTYNEGGMPSTGQPVYLYYKKATNSTYGIFGTGSITYTNGKNQPVKPGNPGSYSESEMTYYESLSYSPILDIVPGNLTSNTNSTTYWFELFTSNGTELAFAEIQLINPYSQNTVGGLFFASELPLLTIFVPLMAVLSAYQTFGKDRANGSLSSVVTRPISRRALVTSRFVSNVVSVMAASSAALGIISLIYHYYLGVYVPTGALLLALWSIFVMTGAFVGLVYLASMFLKSSGQIIGVSVGLFFLLSLLWIFPLPLIPLIVASFVIKEPVGSLAYVSSLVKMDFFSPAALTSVTALLFGNNSGNLFFSGGNFTASQLGISVSTVIVVGLLWVLIPFALALLKFSKFD